MTAGPLPPFVELSFYVHGEPEPIVFERLVRTLIRLGSAYAGSISVISKRGIRGEAQLASVVEAEEIRVSELEAVLLLRAPDTLVTRVMLRGATGTGIDEPAIVTYVHTSDQAREAGDRHPFAIWSSGALFEDGPSEVAERVGQHVRERFVQLARILAVDYGAITVEDFLPTPTELAESPGSFMFSDFFVGASIPSVSRQAIETELRGAYTERYSDGTYFSCAPEFNPARAQVAVATQQSARIAVLLSDHVLGGR